MKKEIVDADLTEGLKELLSVRHVVKEYKKGTYLFQEGDTIEGVYIILSGNVQIGKVTPDGRELTLRVCGENQLVGEVAVFSSPSKYRLDAKAIENSVCVQVLIEDLEEALLADVQLAAAFMKWMGIDQQKMQTKFRDLVINGKKGALYSTLIRLSNSYGVQQANGLLIDLVLTNQELANFCGMTREVVNRMLNDLRKQGKISMVDGKWIIHDILHLRHDINCEDCPIYLCKID